MRQLNMKSLRVMFYCLCELGYRLAWLTGLLFQHSITYKYVPAPVVTTILCYEKPSFGISPHHESTVASLSGYKIFNRITKLR